MYMTLTDSHQAFLLERPHHRTDASAARKIGIDSRTPTKWRMISEEFRTVYAKTMAAREKALETFNESYIKETLRPKAIRQMESILDTPIRPDTPPALVGHIKDTSIKVLTATGDLRNEDSATNNIIAFIQSAQDVKPTWSQPVYESTTKSADPAPFALLSEEPQPLDT